MAQTCLVFLSGPRRPLSLSDPGSKYPILTKPRFKCGKQTRRGSHKQHFCQTMPSCACVSLSLGRTEAVDLVAGRRRARFKAPPPLLLSFEEWKERERTRTFHQHLRNPIHNSSCWSFVVQITSKSASKRTKQIKLKNKPTPLDYI